MQLETLFNGLHIHLRDPIARPLEACILASLRTLQPQAFGFFLKHVDPGLSLYYLQHTLQH